jgi:hypothetical protein
VQALGSPECERMLHGIAALLGVRRTDLWYDDMLQAARFRIWRAQGREVAASTVADRAMIDEMARCGIDRGRYARGHRLVSLDDLDMPEPVCEARGPEALAHAASVLQQLDARHPGWVEAIIAGDVLRDAGRAMGRSEVTASIMCSRLTRMALQLADSARRAPPVARPRRARKRRPKNVKAQARAAECLALAQDDALAPDVQFALVLLADCGGCYKRAAAALDMQPGTMRTLVMRARRAVA